MGTNVEETIILDSMQEYEGFSVEEAVLTSKARSKLPNTAFCGPNRTYPAHDKKHVRNGLARLSQFGKRLKPATRSRIRSCLKKRAKKMGIEVSESLNNDASTKILEWYINEVLPKKLSD